MGAFTIYHSNVAARYHTFFVSLSLPTFHLFPTDVFITSQHTFRQASHLPKRPSRASPQFVKQVSTRIGLSPLLSYPPIYLPTYTVLPNPILQPQSTSFQKAELVSVLDRQTDTLKFQIFLS